MAKFLSTLTACQMEGDTVWALGESLVYQSDLIGMVIVPQGFETDFASVPRIPVVFTLWGDRAHREAVIHDYLYRRNSRPVVSIETANSVFLEAMECLGKSAVVRYPMYWGVCLGGSSSYHKRNVEDKLR